MDHVYLSVIIPAYNEGKRIGVTLSRIQEYLSTVPYTYEVLVVNDGSTDETTEVVTAFARSFPGLTLIDCSPNAGKGNAVHRGMMVAKGRYRLFMDADNSVDISELPKFMTEVATGAGVVIGSIELGGTVIEHNGFHRRIFGSLSKLLIRALAVPGIYDTQRGFKLFTEEAAESIFPKQTIARYGFDIELLVIARVQGYRIVELPVYWDNPPGSKIGLDDYITTLFELLKIVRNNFRRSYSVHSRTRNRLKDGYEHERKIVSA